MEPFSIRCTTCHAGLKVRKPEALGQIYACPKCGGMVLIERPAPVASPKVDGADAANDQPKKRRKRSQSPQAVTEAASTSEQAYDHIDSILRDGPDSNNGDVAVGAAAGSRKDGSEHAGQAVAAGALAATFDAFESAESITPIGPNETWTAENSSPHTKSFFVIGGACLLGVAMAIGLASVLGGRGIFPKETPPNVPVQQESKTAVVAHEATSDQPPAQIEFNPNQNSDLAPALEEPTPDQEVAVHAAEAPKKSSSPLRSAIDVPSRLDLIDSIPESEGVAKSPGAWNSDGGNQPASFEQDAAASMDVGPASSRPIDHFGDVGQGNSREDFVSHSLPRLPERLQTSGSDAPPPRPVIEPLDVDARLREPIVATELTTGLDKFLKFVSDLSTIPITVRPEALIQSRIGYSQKVKVSGNDTTIANSLRQALNQIRLDYQTDAGHVIVETQSTVRGVRGQSSHFVGDLLQVGFSQEQLAGLVRSMIQPASWEGQGGHGALSVTEKALVATQTQAVHSEIMYFCERLRTTHGLALQSNLTSEDLGDLWRDRRNLSQAIAPQRRPKTNLGQALRDLDQSAGKSVRILTDWHALAAAGWEPNSEVPRILPTRSDEFSDALSNWLRPLDLTYRYAGQGLIELTTAEAELNRYEIGFHEIQDLLDEGIQVDSLIAQLQSGIGTHRFQKSSGDGAIFFDKAAATLIVRLPQSQQIAIEWLLASLRQA